MISLLMAATSARTAVEQPAAAAEALERGNARSHVLPDVGHHGWTCASAARRKVSVTAAGFTPGGGGICPTA